MTMMTENKQIWSERLTLAFIGSGEVKYPGQKIFLLLLYEIKIKLLHSEVRGPLVFGL